mmetsp:Transcript_24391/g.67959  ORF Transcript_24391/g.67959 Transcript_24391/m.67959 type:complete len:102 (+) Transcript_24391:1195-1500(+)
MYLWSLNAKSNAKSNAKLSGVCHNAFPWSAGRVRRCMYIKIACRRKRDEATDSMLEMTNDEYCAVVDRQNHGDATNSGEQMKNEDGCDMHDCACHHVAWMI